MRTMISDTGTELKVYAHFMIKNMWEYYVTELPDKDGIGEALVVGYETELGNYSKEEVKPYVLCYTESIHEDEVIPATGWYWKD